MRKKLEKSGVAIKVKVPVDEFVGVAVSTSITEEGVLSSAIELVTANPELNYRVFEEIGNANVVAEWQNWGRKSPAAVSSRRATAACCPIPAGRRRGARRLVSRRKLAAEAGRRRASSIAASRATRPTDFGVASGACKLRAPASATLPSKAPNGPVPETEPVVAFFVGEALQPILAPPVTALTATNSAHGSVVGRRNFPRLRPSDLQALSRKTDPSPRIGFVMCGSDSPANRRKIAWGPCAQDIPYRRRHAAGLPLLGTCRVFRSRRPVAGHPAQDWAAVVRLIVPISMTREEGGKVIDLPYVVDLGDGRPAAAARAAA